MKIGVLTFHFAHNYGAMLQAYALIMKLQSLGFDAEVIDYRLPCIYDNHEKKTFFQFFKKNCRYNNWFIAALKTIKNYWKNRFRGKRWELFETFYNDFIPKSERVFNVLNACSYDAIIYGSDQIWNSKLTEGLQPVYFADGIPKSVKKIAYAASCGTNSIDKSDQELFKKLINNFDTVSVREMDFSFYLRRLMSINVPVVIDPIFLLKKEEWKSICNKDEQDEYALIYSFNEDDKFYNVVNRFIEMCPVRIVAIKYKFDPCLKGVEQKTNVGPLQFVNLIMNAKYVITNSFHGTAFSLLFEKNFITIRPMVFAGRLDSLLNLFCLVDRIVDKDDDIKKLEVPIDYEKVRQKIDEFRNKSVLFLRENLV